MQDFYQWRVKKMDQVKVPQYELEGDLGLADVAQIVRPFTWMEQDPESWKAITRRNLEGESQYRIGHARRKRKPVKFGYSATEGEGPYDVARDLAALPGEDPDELSMDVVRDRLLGDFDPDNFKNNLG